MYEKMLIPILVAALCLACANGEVCLVEPHSWLNFTMCNSSVSNGTLQTASVVQCGNVTVFNPEMKQDFQYTVPGNASSIDIQCLDVNTMQPSGTCQDACADPLALPTIKCGGDSYYCANSNFTCRPGNKCYCRMVNIVTITQIYFNGAWCNVTNTSLAVFETINKKGIHMNGSTWSTARELFALDSVSTGIYVSFDGSSLTYNSLLTNYSGYIVISKMTWNVLVPYTGGFLQYSLPQEVFGTSGTLKSDIYMNGLPFQSDSFSIAGRKLCIVSDCIFCESTWRNWGCLHAAQKMVVVMLLIMLFCLFAAACPALVMTIIWGVRCLLFPVKMCMRMTKSMWRSKFRKDMTNKTKKAYKLKEYFFDESKDEESPESPRRESADAGTYAEQVRSLSRVRGRGTTVAPITVLAILSFLAVSVSAQCSSGVFIPSTFLNCVNNGTTQTCQMSLQLTASIQTVGAKTCFSIYNPENSTDIIAMGEVEFVSMTEYFTLAYQYDTMSWKGLQASEKKCPSCSCSSVYPDDVTAGRLDGTQLLANQGRTICNKGCACAGCGCFYCTSSCIYSRYSIAYDGSGKNAKIYQITSGVKQPKVKVTIKDSKNQVIASGQIDLTGYESPFGPFNIQIIGSLASDVTPYLQNKIIFDWSTFNVFWGPASDANAPVQGSVGEVQSTNVYSMLNGENPYGPEHTYMQYAESMVSTQTGSTSTRYTFTASAYDKMYNFIPLPAYIGGNYWTSILNFDQNNGAVTSQVLSPGALLVTVSTLQNISFSRTVDLVCPDGEFVNATGCYSCEIGVSLIFNLRSTCSGGFAAVQSLTDGITVLTPSVILDTLAQQKVILINTNIANNNACISFVGSGFNKTICAVFTASFYSPQSPSGPNNNGTNVDQHSDGCDFVCQMGNFFKKIFKGIASWWQYLLFVVIFIIVFLIFLWALPYIIKFFSFVFRTGKNAVGKLKKKKASKFE